MCTGGEALAVQALMAAGSAYAAKDSADSAANEQKKIIAQGEEENANINKAGNERVNQFAKDIFDPNARDKRYEEAATQREGSLSSALTDAAPKAAVENAGGKLSSDFLNASAASSDAAMVDAQKRGKLLARTGAGGLLYGNEAMMGGDLQTDLAGLQQQSRRNGMYTGQRVGNVRNQGSLAGGLLSGLGSAGMSYAGSKYGKA
jgi:hypothetical protein